MLRIEVLCVVINNSYYFLVTLQKQNVMCKEQQTHPIEDMGLIPGYASAAVGLKETISYNPVLTILVITSLNAIRQPSLND